MEFPGVNPVSRRALLRIGALSPLGLGLPTLLRAAPSSSPSRGTFGRAKRCLLLYMWGGPSHIDLWDMKPDAPSEIRGEFRPVSTKVPGIRICEHLPHLARHTDKIGFIRSVTHTDNNHSTSAHWMLTGHRHALSAENFGARRSDYPHLGSVVSKFAPSQNSLPAFVSLPNVIGTTAGFIAPGQNGGFMGGRYDPFCINQYPNDPDFSVADLGSSGGITSERLRSRMSLLEAFEQTRRTVRESPEVSELNAFQQRAIDLVTAPEVLEAFDLNAEGAAERERYGMRTFGQSVLLARRLLERGVKLVTVYWHRERDKPTEDYSWDTHADNFRGLRNRLIPQVDRPIAMLLEDLARSGMLEDTLVVWSSEFGRTPKVNKRAGRDHWGRCNTIWMAGAGVPGGQLYGKSDEIASEPVSDPVAPADVTSTIFHLLGLDSSLRIHDNLNRPFSISEGKPLRDFLGEA